MSRPGVSRILETLEAFYGPQEPAWPTDPYLYLVWLHCGYPASDERCSKGWESLRKATGLEPDRILAAPLALLAKALTAGGMVPESRARRLHEVASRVIDECGGDLRRALTSSPSVARKLLKKFPNIADPGADRILLFSRVSPVAAVPSNCPHVIVRIMQGRVPGNYGLTYSAAQQEIQALPESFEARTRAFLLLKRHGHELCKSSKPKCVQCPLRQSCAYSVGEGGRVARAQVVREARHKANSR